MYYVNRKPLFTVFAVKIMIILISGNKILIKVHHIIKHCSYKQI